VKRIPWIFAVLIGLVAWVYSNHQTGVRINVHRAYRSGEAELAAVRAIRAGDKRKAIAVLEERLRFNALVLKTNIDSSLNKRNRRDEAIQFMADYEKYVADQAGSTGLPAGKSMGSPR